MPTKSSWHSRCWLGRCRTSRPCSRCRGRNTSSNHGPRCCYENLYWVERLLDDGQEFVRFLRCVSSSSPILRQPASAPAAVRPPCSRDWCVGMRCPCGCGDFWSWPRRNRPGISQSVPGAGRRSYRPSGDRRAAASVLGTSRPHPLVRVIATRRYPPGPNVKQLFFLLRTKQEIWIVRGTAATDSNNAQALRQCLR